MTPTARQQRFIDEYLVDLNATQAAIRAGYSAKTARQTAAETLSKPYIAAAVAAKQSERAEKLELTAAGITQGLVRIADNAEKLGGAPGLSVARQAWMDVAKLNGLIVERREDVTGRPEERAARLAELRAERERIQRGMLADL